MMASQLVPLTTQLPSSQVMVAAPLKPGAVFATLSLKPCD